MLFCLYDMKREKEKFRLPDNYFQNLAQKVLKRIQVDEIYEELYSISVFVAQHIKRKNLFKVPQQYFETLPEQIQARINPHHKKIVHLFKRELIFMLSAACILFIFAFFAFNSISEKKSTVDNKLVHLQDNTIFTALTLEQDELSLETETAKDKDVLTAVTQSIEEQNYIQKNLLEQETDLDKNLEIELEKALENELDNL